MSRHRKIDVRMWGDAKFQSLSSPLPNAQTLWVYLLTGPHTTSIPGLFSAGEAALAEALRWPPKGFKEAFAEIARQGMVEADFAARVVWIPKSIQYNPPESANVVKSWRAYWDEIPECPLKLKAYQHLKAFLEGFGKGFGEAFTKAIGEGYAPAIIPDNTGARTNQEQEQEQDKTPLPPKGETDGFERFWKAYPRKEAKPNAVRAWKKIKPDESLTVKILAAIDLQKRTAKWQEEDGRFVPHPASWLNAHRWEDEVGPLFQGSTSNSDGQRQEAATQALIEEKRRREEQIERERREAELQFDNQPDEGIPDESF